MDRAVSTEEQNRVCVGRSARQADLPSRVRPFLEWLEVLLVRTQPEDDRSTHVTAFNHAMSRRGDSVGSSYINTACGNLCPTSNLPSSRI